MTRISLALLLLSGVYWLLTRNVRGDFAALDGQAKFSNVSCAIGRTEIAWVVNRSGPLIWLARDHGSGKNPFPFIRRVGPVTAIFQQFKWTSEPRLARMPFLSGGVTSFDGIGPTGSPMTIHLIYMTYPSLFAILGVLPAIATMRIGYRRMRSLARRSQVLRRRRSRAKLGTCTCGYDLRAANRRCPECGRAIRLVPVAVA